MEWQAGDKLWPLFVEASIGRGPSRSGAGSHSLKRGSTGVPVCLPCTSGKPSSKPQSLGSVSTLPQVPRLHCKRFPASVFQAACELLASRDLADTLLPWVSRAQELAPRGVGFGAPVRCC